MVEKEKPLVTVGEDKDTIVLMVSIGNRNHLTDITYSRMAQWAARHGYASLLIKHSLTDKAIAPHFNKLIAHRAAPGFKRYIIIDDDIIMKADAPAMETVPDGMVGLCADVIQFNTQAAHVSWTGNTGFIVAGEQAIPLLEEAFENGEYPYGWSDVGGRGIWGPFDQGAVNDVLFSKSCAHQLDWRWNYQAVIDYYANRGKGWDKWQQSRLYRMLYYASLLIPFSKNRKLLNKCYGLHMTMGSYPKFFARIHQ
jgi:hypothetical protein